jgi:hypothetical protein
MKALGSATEMKKKKPSADIEMRHKCGARKSAAAA